MAGGGGQQTSQTRLDPTVQPFVEFGLGEARRLYEAGPPQYYGGQTFVGPSQYTTEAMQAAAERARAGSPLIGQAQQAVGQLTQYRAPTQMLSDIYGRAQTSPAAGIYQQVAGMQAPELSQYQSVFERAGQAPAGGLYQDIYSRAGAVSPDATAGGAYLGYNPFLQGTFAAAARPITQEFQRQISGIQSQASRAGRYGSGAQAQMQTGAAEALAQNLAGLGERLGFQGYQAERQLQEAAISRQQQAQQQAIAQQLAAAGGVQAGTQQAIAQQLAALGGSAAQRAQQAQQLLGAASGLTSAQAQQLQSQLQAASGVSAAEQAAAQQRLAASQAAPALAGEDFTNIQRLANVGAMSEDYQQRQLAADIARFNYQQLAPMQALQSFLGSVYGAPAGMMATQPIIGNPLLGALGGAAAGGFLGQQAGYAVPGAVAGGLLGAYGSR